MEQGADIHACDEKGQNALHWFSKGEWLGDNYEAKHTIPCAQILLEAGGSLTKQNEDDQTPIDLAKEHGFVQLEAFFLSTMIKDNVKENIESKRAVGRGKGLGKLKM